MKIYIAAVTTESLDRYNYAYLNEPTKAEVITELMADEGAEKSDFDWYFDCTYVDICEKGVIGTEENT